MGWIVCKVIDDLFYSVGALCSLIDISVLPQHRSTCPHTSKVQLRTNHKT